MQREREALAALPRGPVIHSRRAAFTSWRQHDRDSLATWQVHGRSLCVTLLRYQLQHDREASRLDRWMTDEAVSSWQVHDEASGSGDGEVSNRVTSDGADAGATTRQTEPTTMLPIIAPTMHPT